MEIDMNKQEIARFLRWGFIDDVEYPEPVPTNEDISFEDAQRAFLEVLKMQLPEDDDFVLAYSGSYTGASYLKLLNRNVKIVTGEFLNNAMYIAGYFHCDLYQNPFRDLEGDLFDIHNFLPQPRCILGDIYVWNRQRYLAENGWVNCLCEGGSDSLLLVNTWADYSRMGILSDIDLQFLGLPHAPITLKNDTLPDLFSAIHYWYNHNMSTIRNNMMADHFGTKILSPYLDPELADLCLRLPFEYKANKKILKKTVPLPIQVARMINGMIYVNLVNMLISKGMMALVDKYVGNRMNKMYTILDYYKVQTIKDPIKLYQLLNLAIWHEVRE
jgi:hypothetical protein